MVELNYTIKINATKQKIWAVLWEDQTFREWANLIDEGTYMKGELKEGGEVEFISSVNGYGVTSFVERLIPEEFVLLKHLEDTQEYGTDQREKEWTGGSESYRLSEGDGLTELTLVMDVPEDLENYFNGVYPSVLNSIKALSERN